MLAWKIKCSIGIGASFPANLTSQEFIMTTTRFDDKVNLRWKDAFDREGSWAMDVWILIIAFHPFDEYKVDISIYPERLVVFPTLECQSALEQFSSMGWHAGMAENTGLSVSFEAIRLTDDNEMSVIVANKQIYCCSSSLALR